MTKPKLRTSFILPTGHKLLLRIVRSGIRLVVILSLVSGMYITITRAGAPTHVVEAATSSTMNFQARLYNSSGSLVPDGNYHIEFKLHDNASTGGGAQGACSGSCLWMETRTTGNLVTVKNGYFSVNLGSLTAFPSLNWDQDMWLSMNIGGTTGPSWDGEMSPRIKLTAVPYAIKAGGLSLNNGAQTGNLNFSTVANSPNILLPDASGTVCLTSGNCAGTGGNGDVLQGGNSFGVAMTIGTNDNFSLAFETNGTTRLTIGTDGNVTFAGSLTVNGGGTNTLTGGLTVNGNVTIGDAATDNLTVTSTILGATPFTFEGATSDSFKTTLAVTDPTANRTITLPNGDGTVCLVELGNCAGSGNGIIGSGTNNRVAVFTASNTIADSYLLQGVSSLTLDANKDLIVDTSTLYVDSTNNTLGVGTTRTGAIDGTGNSRLVVQGSGTTSSTSSLNVRNSSGTGSLFLVRDDGNVGIGTTSPGFPLEVRKDGTGQQTALSLRNANGTVNSSVLLNFDWDTAQGPIARLEGILTDTATSGSGALAFYTRNAGSATEKLRITSTGNVGIGDTNPGQRLDVQGGNINTSGSIMTGGTTRITSTGVLQNVSHADAGNFFTGGTLGVARGGTGTGTFTANGVLYGNGTSAIGATAAGTTGQCLVATTGSAPAWGSCSGSGSGVTLQAAYDNSTNPELVLDATRGALTIRDNATPLGANLLEVQNNAGSTTYLAVSATGTSVTGTLSVSGLASLNGDAKIGSKQIFSLTRTMPTTVDDTVDIGTFGTEYSHQIRATIAVNDSGFSVTKSYLFSTSYNLTAGAWRLIPAISDSGIYNGNNFVLEANQNNATLTLRIRRTAGSTAGTARVTLNYEGHSGAVFTPSSTTTSAAPAVTTIFPTSIITQLNTLLGVNTASPSHLLDVQGGDINTSGSIRTAGTVRITNTGVLQNVSHADAGNFFTGGTLGVARGGTGNSSYTIGDILYASGATTLTRLAGVATGNALISGGVGTAPSWGKIGLTTHVSGTLPVGNGGTGTATAFTQGSVVFAGASGVYSQNNANLFWDDTNTTLGIGTTRSGAINGTENSRLVVQGSGTTSSTSSLNVRNSSGTGSLFLVRDDGNVGIGTTAPQAKLSLGTDLTAQKLLLYDSGNSRYGLGIQANQMRIFTGTGGITTFGHVSTSDGTTFTERARLDVNGLFGIGVTPTRRLHIYNGDTQVDYGHLRFVHLATATAPTVAVNPIAGNLTGNYQYKVSFVTAQGETQPGTASAVVAPSAEQVDITAIPTGTTGLVTQRKLYRTLANGSTYYLLATIADNTTTTFTDNIDDSSLTVLAHSQNTTAGRMFLNGVQSQFIDSISANTATGYSALSLNTSGTYNSALGYLALGSNTTGFYNTALGGLSMRLNTTGNYNTAQGMYSLHNNTSGSYNTANGYGALFNNTTAVNNTSVGYLSLYSNTTGNANTGVGQQALYFNTTGAFNTAVGAGSVISNTTGFGNTGLGYLALYTGTTGNYNVGIGYQAMYLNNTGSGNNTIGLQAFYYNTSGSNNAALGYQAGFGVSGNSDVSGNSLLGYRSGHVLQTGGDFNTLLGYSAGANITTGARNIIIGYNVNADSATGSDQLNIGGAIKGNLSTGNVSIGGAASTSKLTVYSGDILLDRNGTANKGSIYLKSGTSYASDGRTSTVSIPGGLGGRILNRNAGMLYGTTGYNAYNNAGGTKVTISSVADSQAPNSSGKVLRVSYDGTGTPNSNPLPGFGGFSIIASRCTGTDNSVNGFCYREGNRYIHKLWAKIPSGRNMIFASNEIGTGGTHQTINSWAGTGNWEVYEAIQTIGTGGTFSSTGFWYISGGTNEAFTWDVAYVALTGVDEGPSVQATTHLNIGYSQSHNLNFGELLTTNGTYLATTSGNVGIGTTTPSSILSLGGNVARTIQTERHTTSDTAGNDLTLKVGGAFAGATDKNGGNLILSGGTSTGTGTSQILFQTATAGTTGTTDNTPSTKMVIQGNGNVGIGETNPSNILTIRSGLKTITNQSQDQILLSTTDVSNPLVLSLTLSGHATGTSRYAKIDVFETGLIARSLVLQPSGGNVGIGTTTPDTFKLEVSGNIGPEADNTRNLGSSGRRFANLYATNIQGAVTPTGFTQGSVVFAGSGGTLTQDNANFFWDNSNKRLGIGAASPGAPLDVRATGGASAINISTNGASDSKIQFQDGTVDEWYIGRIESDNSLQFVETGVSSRMTILPGGSVGLGITAPENALHVLKAADAIVGHFESASSSTGIEIENTNTGGRRYALFSTANSSSIGGGKFAIQDLGSAAWRLVIDSSGNVGIGDTSPLSKLSVRSDNSASTGIYSIANIAGNQTVSGTATYYGINVNNGYNAASGTLDSLAGVIANPFNNSTGTITNLYGSFNVPQNLTTGTVSFGFGTYSRVDNLSTGTITNLYGNYIASPNNSGTITNKYALVTEANAGNVGIGTTTPSTQLHTTGGIRFASLVSCDTIDTDANGVLSCGTDGGGSTTLQTAYDSSAGGTTPEIKLDSTRTALDIQDANTSIAGNLINVRASNAGGLGAILFSVDSTGKTLFQNSANSTTAVQIQNLAGTSLFTADTSATKIKIGTGTPTLGNGTTGSLYVSDAAEFAGRVLIGTTSNGFDTTSGQVRYSGTFRNTKRLRLTAEYAGAVLDADGSNNTGTMTSAIDAANRMNYYKWTTTQASSQDYDVVIQVPLPSDFSAWSASNPLSYSVYSSTTTANTIQQTITDSGGTNQSTTDITPSSTTTWETKTPSSLSSGTYTAGNYITIRIRLTSPQSGDVRIGNIYLDYLSNF